MRDLAIHPRKGRKKGKAVRIDLSSGALVKSQNCLPKLSQVPKWIQVASTSYEKPKRVAKVRESR